MKGSWARDPSSSALARFTMAADSEPSDDLSSACVCVSVWCVCVCVHVHVYTIGTITKGIILNLKFRPKPYCQIWFPVHVPITQSSVQPVTHILTHSSNGSQWDSLRNHIHSSYSDYHTAVQLASFPCSLGKRLLYNMQEATRFTVEMLCFLPAIYGMHFRPMESHTMWPRTHHPNPGFLTRHGQH